MSSVVGGSSAVGTRRPGKAGRSMAPISDMVWLPTEAMQRWPKAAGLVMASSCRAATSRTSITDMPSLGTAGSLPSLFVGSNPGPNSPLLTVDLSADTNGWAKIWATAPAFNRQDHPGLVESAEITPGRVRLGMGRGLSRREFEPFRGVEMAESRERFDEASLLIVKALANGFFEGDGKFYPTARAEIRPRLSRSFKDRLYAVANSADSVEACAQMGGRMILFSEARWDRRLVSIATYRARYTQLHGTAPAPVMTADFTFCHQDPDYARTVAERCMATYLQSLLEHYELMSTHLDNMPGYQGYGRQAATLRNIGFDKYLDGFLAANAYGTPEQMLAKFRERREIIGEYELATCFRFGGISIDDARASMKLFAAEVLPELQRW